MRTPNPQPPFFARFSGPHSPPFGRCRRLNLERPPHRPLRRPPESLKGLPARPLLLAGGDWLPQAQRRLPPLPYWPSAVLVSNSPASPPVRRCRALIGWLPPAPGRSSPARPPRPARGSGGGGVSGPRVLATPSRIPIGSRARPSAIPSPLLASSTKSSAHEVLSHLPRAHPAPSASYWRPGPSGALRPLPEHLPCRVPAAPPSRSASQPPAAGGSR